MQVALLATAQNSNIKLHKIEQNDDDTIWILGKLGIMGQMILN